MKAQNVVDELKALATPQRRDANMWFFKTGPGEYGEGDQFIGCTSPDMRSVSKKYKDLEVGELQKLVADPIHEVRLTALFIMVLQYKRAKDDETKQAIVELYLRALDDGYVNSWDLVDSSAHKILGNWLSKRDRSLLYEFARSGKLWHQRVAMMSCMHFIDNDDFGDTIKIAEILLNHEHDLIHKVVGWMLRELGKRDRDLEEAFLIKHQRIMPRTMLRYAIEKFDEPRRQEFLKGTAR